jgi:hypothetical protein
MITSGAAMPDTALSHALARAAGALVLALRRSSALTDRALDVCVLIPANQAARLPNPFAKISRSQSAGACSPCVVAPAHYVRPPSARS